MKDKIKATFTGADGVFLLVISLAYYFLLRQHFLVSDDAFYSFIHPEGTQKVQSLWDAIRSQQWDYYNFNGRVLVHSITQYLCGVSYGREIFFVVGTAIHALLLMGLLYVVRSQGVKSSIDKYVLATALFFLLPYYGMVVIGQISFVANYTWSACLFVWFYIIWQELKGKSVKAKSLRVCLLFLFGLIFGAWQESFTIPTAVALFCYYLLHPKQVLKENAYIYALFAGFTIGLFFEVLAPANFVRLGKEHANGGGLSVGSVIGVIKACLDSIRIMAVLASLCVGALLYGRKKLMDMIRRNGLFLLVALVNVLFTAVVAYHDQRQLYVGVLSLIVLDMLLWLCVYEHKHNRASDWTIKIATVIALLVSIVPSYAVRAEHQKAWTAAQDAYNGHPVPSGDIYKLLKKNDGNTFVFYYQEIGFLEPNMKAYFPGTEEEIIDLFADGENFKRIPETDCYAIKLNREDKTEDVKLSVTNRVSYLGKLVRLLKPHATEPSVTIGLGPNSGEFVRGQYKYVVVFLPEYDYPTVQLLEQK